MSHPARFSHGTQTWFIRNQTPSGGGCFLYAALTCMDILFQRQAGQRYAPNLSYAFASYMYNAEHLYNTRTGQWDVPNPHQFKQLEVLQHVGVCSEATMPTNFDGGALRPTVSQMTEAERYRLASWGPPDRPMQGRLDRAFLNRLKEYLFNVGPLVASVWLGPHPVGNEESHAVSLVGYDDASMAFEFINSYGDLWGADGHGFIPYGNFLGSNLFPQIIDVQWLKVATPPNGPSVPCGAIHIVTASPNIGAGRNALTVRLGAVGQTEHLILWDRNNGYVGAGHGLVPAGNRSSNVMGVFDDSRNLVLRFPLPSYPPAHHHVDHDWFLLVENHSIAVCNDFFATVSAVVNGFTVDTASGRQLSCSTPLPVTVAPSATVRFDLKVLPSH